MVILLCMFLYFVLQYLIRVVVFSDNTLGTIIYIYCIIIIHTTTICTILQLLFFCCGAVLCCCASSKFLSSILNDVSIVAAYEDYSIIARSLYNFIHMDIINILPEYCSFR